MNAIAAIIAEFLKQFPPFHHLKIDELAEIASNVRVLTLEKHQTLFQVNDALHDSFYVVATGAVNLMVISDAEETMLNKCGPGDIFGLRPFFAKNNYMMTAKAREESLVYAVPISVFRPFVAGNNNILEFLLESFATNTRNPDDHNRGKLLSENFISGDPQQELQFFQSLDFNKSPVRALPDDPIRVVAQKMTDHLADCAIITQADFPVGIVTDTDLRTKIATGRFPLESPARQIMSSPVVTVPENVSLAEAQLLMLKHSITHLCVTVDGSEKTLIKGIVSQRDIIAAQASNPGVLIKEIKKSKTALDLKSVRSKLGSIIQTSVTKDIPLTHVFSIAGEINFAILRRAVELAILDLGSPPARFAWLSIGSQGRKEQLLLTDQDSILVFEDVAPEKYRDVKNYFLRLAKKVVGTLAEVGYAPCPNGHLASNMLWCKSISDWSKQYATWMASPRESNEIASIFFDYEIVFGDSALEEAITEAIFGNIPKRDSLFFDYLGNDALRKPPALGFFKKFNLEEEGEYRDRFDIKNRAVLPLVDGARLLTLSQGIRGINNTYHRFRQLSVADPRHSDTYQACAEAFLTLTHIRTEDGLRNDTSGQYINIAELPKADREKLKIAIQPMKDLEELIKDKFRLTQFS